MTGVFVLLYKPSSTKLTLLILKKPFSLSLTHTPRLNLIPLSPEGRSCGQDFGEPVIKANKIVTKKGNAQEHLSSAYKYLKFKQCAKNNAHAQEPE